MSIQNMGNMYKRLVHTFLYCWGVGLTAPKPFQNVAFLMTSCARVRWYKQDELHCDRPVYQEKRGDKWSENNWMFFDASDSKWKRRRSVGDTSAGKVWETTLPTWAYTPDRAPWLNQFGHVITKKPSYVDRDGNELDPEKEMVSGCCEVNLFLRCFF